MLLEKVELVQLLDRLDALSWLSPEHLQQHIHEASWDLVFSVQSSAVGMELEEVKAVWPGFQEAEEAVRRPCLMEGRCSKGKHEEKNTQRKDVCGLCSAWQRTSLVYFRCHVDLSSHLFSNKRIFGHGKSEVTVLKKALLGDEDILQLDVHMSHVGNVMHLAQPLDQLYANGPQQRQVSNDEPLSLACDASGVVLSLHVLAQELKQIIIGTVLQHQVISDLDSSIYFNWFLPFEGEDVNDVWTG